MKFFMDYFRFSVVFFRAGLCLFEAFFRGIMSRNNFSEGEMSDIFMQQGGLNPGWLSSYDL